MHGQRGAFPNVVTLWHNSNIRIMRKIFWMGTLALASGLFYGCGDDDGKSSSSINPDDLIGSWAYFREEEIISGESTGLIPYTGNIAMCGPDYIQFLPEGKVRELDFYNEACDWDEIFGGFSIEGNTLFVTDEEGTTDFTIETLNDDELRIRLDDGDDVYRLVFRREDIPSS